MPAVESVDRIEPALIEDAPVATTDVVAELAAKAATLGSVINPRTASNLADLVRIINTYYSNLIEGHNTRPRDIERALAGKLDEDEGRRNLQLEARAHVRAQSNTDRMFAEGKPPDPTSSDFILNLHRDFYLDAPESMLRIKGTGREFMMEPGAWRSDPEHEVEVGQHLPPLATETIQCAYSRTCLVDSSTRCYQSESEGPWTSGRTVTPLPSRPPLNTR